MTIQKILVAAALSIILFLSFPFTGVGQDIPGAREKVEMADRFRQEGKIYVVVAIMGVTLVGLLIYTVGIDRRISRLEREVDQSRQYHNH